MKVFCSDDFEVGEVGNETVPGPQIVCFHEFLGESQIVAVFPDPHDLDTSRGFEWFVHETYIPY